MSRACSEQRRHGGFVSFEQDAYDLDVDAEPRLGSNLNLRILEDGVLEVVFSARNISLDLE